MNIIHSCMPTPMANAARTNGHMDSYWEWTCAATAGKKWLKPANREGLLTPILTLYSEYIPEISGCQQIPADEREELVTKMISNLPRIYEHFEEEREKNKSSSSLH